MAGAPQVRRAQLEFFGRTMEADGRNALDGRPSALDTRELLPVLPRRRDRGTKPGRHAAANVRRPKVDVESRTLGPDRNELSGLLVQVGLGSGRDHAPVSLISLISLLALNGLRISEALGAYSTDMDRGHRTLAIVRKGDQHVTIPLAPRTARSAASDLFLGGARWACSSGLVPVRSGPPVGSALSTVGDA